MGRAGLTSGRAVPSDSRPEAQAAVAPGREARKSKRRQDRLDRILDAAAAVIDACGYESTTLEMIGESVGLSKGSLYHYFEGKDDLLAQLYANALDRMLRMAEDRIPAEADATTRLRHHIGVHVSFGLTDPVGRTLVTLNDLVASRPELQTARDSLIRYQRVLSQIIRDGITEGSFAMVSVSTAVAVIGGSIYSVVRSTLAAEANGTTSEAALSTPESGPSGSDVGAIADEITALLLGGLERGARGGAERRPR